VLASVAGLSPAAACAPSQASARTAEKTAEKTDARTDVRTSAGPATGGGAETSAMPRPERATARAGLATDPAARERCLAFERALAHGKPVEVLPADQPATVRAKPAELCPREGEAALARLGAADARSACFVNLFVGIERHLVADRATGLMWMTQATQHELSWAKTQAYVRATNGHKTHGYADWRVPTLEEIATLLESVQSQRDYYAVVDTRIFWGEALWLADSCGKPRCRWYLDTHHGPACVEDREVRSAQVVLVRTVRAEDFPPVTVEAGLAVTPEERGKCLAAERAYFVAGQPWQVRARRPPVELRAAPARIDLHKLTEDLVSRGLYSRLEDSPSPCFVNQLVNNADGTVGDLATGLAWEPGVSAQNVTLPAALAHVRALNTKRYLGHDDWRLPTADEIVSIAESVQFYAQPSRLDPAFLEASSTVWLADQDPGGKDELIFDLRMASFWGKAYPPDDENAVKVVRTAVAPGGR
jgi:hypothetical protein